MSDCGEQAQNLSLRLNFSVDRLLDQTPPSTESSSGLVSLMPTPTIPRAWLDWATGGSQPSSSGRNGMAMKNRSPRVPFSRLQVQILEAKFQDTLYLSGLEVRQLALLLNISESRVKIWFQNRRARKRREEARIWRDSFREATAAASAAAAAVATTATAATSNTDTTAAAPVASNAGSCCDCRITFIGEDN